jgi:LmbE family N-acetylglucosaminyl deacetylase
MTGTTRTGDGPRLVVVSAHLDDAVLSAALQLMRPGAHLVTVCTGEPPEGTPPADWDQLTGATEAAARVRERLVEDDRALATLGVQSTTRLGFPDGQHIPDVAERPTRDALAAALRAHLTGVAEVWAPAGIGGHLDHLVTRDATLAAVDPGATVHHYADLPYSLTHGWPEPSVEGWLVDQLDASTGLTRTVHQLDPDDQRRKVAAMSCYVTQLPALDEDGVLTKGDPAVVGFEVSWTLAFALGS